MNLRRNSFPSELTLAFTLTLFVGARGSTALAQYQIDWYTIDGGGAMSSTGGSFDLFGTIGQPDAQVPPVMTGGSFQLTGGFWPVANVCFCLADMNGDGKNDGRDVQLFLGCILAGGNCACADVDAANGVTLADVPVFVNELLAGPNCP